MTRLFNDPASFTEDMLAGFVDAHRRHVRRVSGGVVRSAPTPTGKAAVVIGGGSGHYPAFCGLVGPGFADGAVVGNVFTSPSAYQVESVARAVSAGGGVLLMSGNYTGDVINFEMAREALCGDGLETTYLTVTDDVASAPEEHQARRRGVAGGFVVFKAAGVAADRGATLGEVVRIANHANSMTRTLGVAFSGCTLPGDSHPLFTVPAGRMGVGLGIHGEAGIAEEPQPTAAELAGLLVDRLVGAAPRHAPARVAVVLNGLGSVKYEELFVVWASAASRLRGLGLEVVEPEIGELVTSLDMAGCSLTLAWLDDELEDLWLAPADTPAFRKHASSSSVHVGEHSDAQTAAPDSSTGSAAPDDPCARAVVEGLARMARALEELGPELGRLDAIAGDGDHGRGMTRGSAAALEAAHDYATHGALAGRTLEAAGEAWAATAGGTSGALWGAGLSVAGRLVAAEPRPGPALWADAVRAAYDEVKRLGQAAPGDKTMLDALGPFVEALELEQRRGAHWLDAWATAAEVAQVAALATAALRPRVGRARPLAELSVGTPDPGAVSLAACVRAAIPPAAGVPPTGGDA